MQTQILKYKKIQKVITESGPSLPGLLRGDLSIKTCVIISKLCRDLSAYVMISVHGMTAAAPSGRIAAMSAQPSCGMEDSNPRVYPSICPGSPTGYQDLVSQSLHEVVLATSHQSIDPKYGRLSIVLCKASEIRIVPSLDESAT